MGESPGRRLCRCRDRGGERRGVPVRETSGAERRQWSTDLQHPQVSRATGAPWSGVPAGCAVNTGLAFRRVRARPHAQCIGPL